MTRFILPLCALALVAAAFLAFTPSPPGPVTKLGPTDILLLHDGDRIKVWGGSSIDFVSLSQRSRLDVTDPRRGTRVFIFSRADHWQVFERSLGPGPVILTLRESPDTATEELPACSDVLVRITRPGQVEVTHDDTWRRGQNCSRCGAKLDW